MFSTCKLCNQNNELKQSHVIPKFVGKWLKNTSSTGYLIAVDTEGNPERSQDLFKTPILCSSCEAIFSEFETYFAKYIFYPFKKDSLIKIDDNFRITKFAVSVSLRILWVLKESQDELALKWSAALDKLEKEWVEYILDQKCEVKGENTHHILFSTEGFLAAGLPSSPNLILNLLRTSGFYIYENFGGAYIFSNLAGVQILSMISPADLPNSQGSQVYPIQTLGKEISGIGWGGYFQNILEYSKNLDLMKSNLPQSYKDLITESENRNPEKSKNSEDRKIFNQQKEILNYIRNNP
jgi:hypothetical protein